MKRIAAFTALALLPLAACSSGQEEPGATASATQEAVAGEAPSSQAPPADTATQDAQVLGLEGLGDLKIGQPLPKGSSWAVRGAQESDSCTTVSSPDYPGAYAIVTQGKVRRITLGANSTVKLAEGIGVGASEADVKRWFAGFREEPHKYEAAPAKYLTAPNARPGESALRFEIGSDGKVGMIHVGEMPVLAYVEGCA
ncbi:hypothetical protein [Novosphingobium guangzhouense]|uniref:Lipoprotein n=1 Tax=Novosphingobium guangzhouense TaxID=1850347 RepID=A0A2K2FUF5_9SPHN|nr:hypothetical protein [Novosphingobium guangzhouense]PNU02412.1 hypothetical protein A8V01_08425 [Novosphingobium guangzhouense]